MSGIGSIRKTVGRPLNGISPLLRLERLRVNAKPFIKNPRYNNEAAGVIIRKVVGAAGSK
jgi:hypothetical protein